jgi:hypothetical protein
MGKCICILEEGQEITMDEGCWTVLSLKRECDGYYLEAWGDEKVDKRINYCPKCGRKLDGRN